MPLPPNTRNEEMRIHYTNEANVNARMKMWREIKRQKEEEKRWERFLLDREAFDDAVEAILDSYEFMMLNK